MSPWVVCSVTDWGSSESDERALATDAAHHGDRPRLRLVGFCCSGWEEYVLVALERGRREREDA